MFSSKNFKLLWGPLNLNNPVIVQILGICSSLAVTAKLKPAFVMAVSVTVVTAFSNLVMSLLLVDQVLKAYVYDVSKQLSVFVGLIITNCIIMGRVEAFALSNKPWPSFLDGIGNGLGYGLILIVIAFVRELFGAGTLWGYRIIPESAYLHGYMNNSLMLLPPMALILVGVIIWIHRSKNRDLIEK